MDSFSMFAIFYHLLIVSHIMFFDLEHNYPELCPKKINMIIIADAHVDESRGNAAGFFQMLEIIEKTDHDVVFLGDIFELWIALPRYEKDFHRNFTAWCEIQKRRRSIGFIEGNHEYFVAARKQEYFSWCSDGAGWTDAKGLLFCHGDQINRCDKNYLLFRKISKNPISKTLVRFLPFGPRILEMLKQFLKRTNLDFRESLPQQAIADFAEIQFNAGIHTIFAGHFHRAYRYRNAESKTLYIVPGWYKAQQIMLYEKQSGRVSSCNWRELQNLSKPNPTTKTAEPWQ